MTQTPHSPPNLSDLEWSISKRSDIESALLELYKVSRSDLTDSRLEMTAQLTGIAFALWRAVFLDQKERNQINLKKAMEHFLEKLVTHNAIGFNDDRTNSAWTVGYYLADANYRLKATKELLPLDIDDKKREKIETLIGEIKDRGGKTQDDTKGEWVVAYKALKELLELVKNWPQ